MLNNIEMINMSDVGSIRPHNEDSTASHSEVGFAIVADGMGGYNAGEAASAIAVTSIVNSLCRKLPRLRRASIDKQAEALRIAVEKANKNIYDLAHTEDECKGMGTTVVAALFHKDGYVITAHVGDSRIYRLRDNHLSQVTKDHSLIQEMVDKGLCTMEEATELVSKTYVTRALGIAKNVVVDVGQYEYYPGDIYLLCSDGLNDMVQDKEIHLNMVKHAGNLQTMAEHLIKTANRYGGKDNISTILVRVRDHNGSLVDEDKTDPSSVGHHKKKNKQSEAASD